MATKIRLQRGGRKKRAFFQIVVTDSRAPRDGRFIEKLGTYNPITNPATIVLDVDKATKWLLTGAEPTNTAGAILRYKGANYKKHLQVGVNKGSITQEQADAKFAIWLTEKDAQLEAKKSGLANAKDAVKDAAKKAETAKKEAIAAKVAAKNNPEIAEIIEETTENTEVSTEIENANEEAPHEVTETVVENTTEEVAPEIVVAEVITEEAAPVVVETVVENTEVKEETLDAPADTVAPETEA